MIFVPFFATALLDTALSFKIYTIFLITFKSSISFRTPTPSSLSLLPIKAANTSVMNKNELNAE